MLKITISSFILLILLSNHAYAFRCSGQLVSEGERKTDVTDKCGGPDLIEEWKTEMEFFKKGKESHNIAIKTRVVVSSIEEWTYNLGPSKFMQHLKFSNGKLVKIEHGPKGYEKERSLKEDKTRCGMMVGVGDRKLEVIRKCGERADIENKQIKRVNTVLNKESSAGNYRQSSIYLPDYMFRKEESHKEQTFYVNSEEWIYNFGPSYFKNYIKFENGKVIEIKTGDYGD